MKNISKIGTLGLALAATAGATQPLHAAKPLTTAAKDSHFAKGAEQPKERTFCTRYVGANSRIVRQGCKTQAGWELVGVELLAQK